MTEIEIRKALEEITLVELLRGDVAMLKDMLQNQAERIEKIIGAKALPLPLEWGDEFQSNINCHAYTLGFWKNKAYREILYKNLQIKRRHMVDSNFMERLIDAKIITSIDAPVKNSLALYIKNNKIEHSGLFRGDNCVQSKWGDLPVFRHMIRHVPESYGESRYYVSKGKEAVHEFLLKYLLELKSPANARLAFA